MLRTWLRRNTTVLMLCASLLGAAGAVTIALAVQTTPAPTSFSIEASDCRVQFAEVTTQKEGSICSVILNRSTYPYVSGKGSSCRDIDLTRAENFKPETQKWVIRLKDKATFSFFPVRQATTTPELSTEFTGAVKDQYGEGEVSCGMLPK